MYIVFQCRKCEHQLYVEQGNGFAEDIFKIQRIANKECPNCGEEGYANWILLGLADEFPGEDEE